MKVWGSWEDNEYTMTTDFGRIWFKGYRILPNQQILLIGASGERVGSIKPSRSEEFLRQVEEY